MNYSEKRKVCILSTAYPRFKDDYINPFVHYFAKGISRYYDVFVVSSSDKIGEAEQMIDGMHIHRFNYFFPRRWQSLTYTGGMGESFKSSWLAKIQLPFFILSFLVSSLRECRKSDIIHAHWTLSGFVALFAKFLYKKPVVLTLHGGDMRYLPKWFNRFVLRNVDMTISAHDDLVDEAKKLGCKKIMNIKNMMDFDKFTNVSQEYFRKEFHIKNEPVITFVGRLEPMKDPLTFVKSAKYVINKIHNAKFFVIGNGHLSNEIKALINDLRLEKNVFLIGPRGDINKVLAATTIFTAISPIENCFSTTIIEAMLSGVPCIVTKAGMTKRFFNHKKDSYLIPPRDEKALADAIISLIKNPGLRKDIVNGSKLFLENNGFSEELIIKRIKEVYDTVYNKKFF